jgi:hypothetical protein
VPFSAPQHVIQQRVLDAERHHREHRIWLIALVSSLASVISAAAAWAAIFLAHGAAPGIQSETAPRAPSVVSSQSATITRSVSPAFLHGSAPTQARRALGPALGPSKAGNSQRPVNSAPPTAPRSVGTDLQSFVPLSPAHDSHAPLIAAPPSVDYIYWTFSSAAQCISAFIALLLSGYAIVQTLMEAVRDRDDSLEDIHSTLRYRYHRRLSLLGVLTGGAILVSLYIVYDNRPWKASASWLLVTGGVLDVAAIVFALFFVVSIIDPKKYEKAAKAELRAEKKPTGAPEPITSASEFFDVFLRLERAIRDFLRQNDLYIPSKGSPRMSFSFRQMIDSLLQNETIDRPLYGELLEINRYRNLVFHGHVEQASSEMIQRTELARKRLDVLLNNRSS